MKEKDMKATMNCKMNGSEQCGIDSLSTILANENEESSSAKVRFASGS